MECHAPKRTCRWAWPIAAAMVATLVGSIFAAVPAMGETEPFHASYSGTFTLTFGGGPNGTNVLDFLGTGTGIKLGNSTTAGHSLLQPVNQSCSTIVQDQVTLTAVDGDSLSLRNAGQDCFDRATNRITGSGGYTITGGQGRFGGASGTGTFNVTAQVTNVSGNVAKGTFDPLTFDGTITLPGS